MHRLLARQVKRHLGDQVLESPGAAMAGLLDAIDRYYTESEQERRQIEHAMAVNSQELADAMAQAQSGHALLRGVMDSIPDLIFFKSTEGRYLGSNKAYQQFLQKSAQEIIGKTDFDLLDPALANDIYEHDRAVLRSGREHVMERWLTGSKLPNVCLEVMRLPYFDADGHPLGIIAIARDITARKRADETIRYQANFDSLTELPNRRHFHERLELEMQRTIQHRCTLALMLIDLDKFKQVNDVLGHNVGDQVLIEAARRIRSCVRESDLVARLGGDEFTVVVNNLQQLLQAEVIAQKIIDRLAAPFQLGDEVANVSASIGITFYPEHALNADELLKSADQAMYYAKSNGRNGYSHYTHELQEAATRRRRLVRDLPQVVHDRQLVVCYQPIVSLSDGSIRKAEALVRWQHPALGPISPAEFIPLAEESGTIMDIGDYVFQEAARFAKRLRSNGHGDFQISVNKSPAQFRGARDLSASWSTALNALDLPGSAIAIEITEGMLMTLEDITRERLNRLRRSGMLISLDDFGTGYSSLSYLKKLDIDFLKIDRSFVHDLESSPDARAVAEAMIVMAQKLDLQTVAEGVETEGQRQFLANCGCDYAQGWLFAKALPAEHFEAYLAQAQPPLKLAAA